MSTQILSAVCTAFYELSNLFVAICLIFVLPRYIMRAVDGKTGRMISAQNSSLNDGDAEVKGGATELDTIQVTALSSSAPSPTPSPPASPPPSAPGSPALKSVRKTSSSVSFTKPSLDRAKSVLVDLQPTADLRFATPDLLHPTARAIQVLRRRGVEMAQSILDCHQRMTKVVPKDLGGVLLWTYLCFRVVNFIESFLETMTSFGKFVLFIIYGILMIMCVVAHNGNPDNQFVYVLLVGLGQLASNLPGYFLLYIIRDLNLQDWSQFVWLALLVYHIVAMILKRYLMYVVNAIPAFYASYIPAWIFYTQFQESLFPKILFLQVPSLTSWFFWVALLCQIVMEGGSYSQIVRGIILDRSFRLYLRIRVKLRLQGAAFGTYSQSLRPPEADHIRLGKIMANQKMYTNLMGTYFVPLCVLIDHAINQGNKSLSLGITDLGGTIKAFAVLGGFQLLIIILSKGLDHWCRRYEWASPYFPRPPVPKITKQVERKFTQDMEAHLSQGGLVRGGSQNQLGGSQNQLNKLKASNSGIASDSPPPAPIPAKEDSGPTSSAETEENEKEKEKEKEPTDKKEEEEEKPESSPRLKAGEKDPMDQFLERDGDGKKKLAGSRTKTLSDVDRALQEEETEYGERSRLGACDWATSPAMFVWFGFGVCLAVQDVIQRWFQLQHPGF